MVCILYGMRVLSKQVWQNAIEPSRSRRSSLRTGIVLMYKLLCIGRFVFGCVRLCSVGVSGAAFVMIDN